MAKRKMGGGKRPLKGKMLPQTRANLQLTRLNSTLTSKSVNVDGVLKELGVESYADYLFKVFLPNRASVRFPGLSTKRKAALMKYLIVGIEVWQLITSDKSVDSEPSRWPGLATLKHAARLDEILDQYYEVLKWEEGRQLFLVNFAQAVARSVTQETTIDPPPPVKYVKGNTDVEGSDSKLHNVLSPEYKTWVEREFLLDKYLRNDLQLDFSQLIITNEYVEGGIHNGLPRQTLISATGGIITQGTPGTQYPEEVDDNGNPLYPWPLYINVQVVDEIMSIIKFMVLSNYRNSLGTTAYHTAECIPFEPYPKPQLQITSLFYHPAIPEELKTIFQPIADDNNIKLSFVYPETPEELEKFRDEYLPSQEALNGAALMNEVLGTNTSPEVADKIMNVLLGANTLNPETLEALSKLGLNDDDKIVGIANMVLDDDYGIFEKIEPGLGDKVKELVAPILSAAGQDTTYIEKPTKEPTTDNNNENIVAKVE